MQNHLAAAANQGTGNYWGVRRSKDKVFIQKVQPGLRTDIGTLRNRKVRSKICLCAYGTGHSLYLMDVGRVLLFIVVPLYKFSFMNQQGIFSNEWEVCEKKICFIYFIRCITQNFKSSSCHSIYFSRRLWIVSSLTCCHTFQTILVMFLHLTMCLSSVLGVPID